MVQMNQVNVNKLPFLIYSLVYYKFDGCLSVIHFLKSLLSCGGGQVEHLTIYLLKVDKEDLDTKLNVLIVNLGQRKVNSLVRWRADAS